MDAGIFLAMTISFVLTYVAMPHAIRKLKENGFVVKDMYKQYQPNVPTKGGVVLLFTVFLTLVSIAVWFWLLNKFTNDPGVPPDLTQTDTAIMLVVAMYALYGMTDDLIDIGRPAKVILPLVFSYPLLVVVTPSNFSLPLIGAVDFDAEIALPIYGNATLFAITRIAIMPIYIMVVANLLNMHSGFNGMQSGLATIVLLFLILKCIIDDLGTNNIISIGAFTGGMMAFWLFNRYPSKIFEGNIGALAMGSSIGCIIIVKSLIFAGFVMLIPHTINFLLYVYWRIMQKRKPSDKRYAVAKFGKTRKADGTLDVPNPYTLKWVLPFYYRLTEKQAANAMYGVTIIFCIIGLFVPA